MKTIIAGSRTITNINLVLRAIDLSGFEITEVVSGKEPNGVDALGEAWAKMHSVRVEPFPPDWDDVSVPGAVVRRRKDGSLYNAAAGAMRNEQMAQYADALIALPRGESKGTRDMIRRAKAHGLKVYVYEVNW